jgi:hypothetical protein
LLSSSVTMRADRSTAPFLDCARLVDLLRTRQQPGRPDGRIQLDLKEPLAGITPEVRRRFTAVLDGLGGWFTLSGLDWLAVQRLARAVPGLVTGFDPEDAIENGMPVDQAAAYCLSTAPSASTFPAPRAAATISMCRAWVMISVRAPGMRSFTCSSEG